MSVVPIDSQPAESETGDGYDISKPLIVFDVTPVTFLASAELSFMLENDTRIAPLTDPYGFRYFLKSHKVVFLMSIRYHPIQSALQEMWIHQIKENMQGDDVYVYSVYVLENPTILAQQTPFQREIYGYEDPFQWLPFVLRFMFRSERYHDLPSIVDMAQTQKSAEYTRAVGLMFIAFGLTSGPRSIEHYIVFHESVTSEDQQMFRIGKLSGGFIHAFSIDNFETSNLNDLYWFSSRQDNPYTLKRFILRLMLDTGIIEVKHGTLDKIPAIQIATPIKLRRPTFSSVTLRWKGLKEYTDKSRIVVKQRSDNAAEWLQIGDTLPGSSSAYTATDLQLNQRYQFALIVESYDNESDPTFSDWFSIEVSDSKAGGLPSKMLWVVLMTLVLILDLPAVFLLIAAVTLMVIVTIVIRALTCCQIPKIFQWIWENNPKQIIISLFIMFFLGHLSAAWMIVDVINEGDDTSPFLSPIYITPGLYMLVWTITANIVSHKFFECEYGVFSLPGRIVDNFRFVDLMVRVHESTEVETVLTVRDIE